MKKLLGEDYVANEIRRCLYCDQEVKEPPDPEKVWGKGETKQGFIHNKSSSGGIPYCGRQFLNENQTYTEGDRDPRAAE